MYISVCVYLHCTRHVYARQYENTLSCDVATFTSFYCLNFVNWNSGNVFLCTFFFYLAWSVFFAIPSLPVLQPHCDKIAITHMFVSATVFFLQSQHISGLQPQCQGCLQSPVFFTKLQPHQAKTNLVTSSFLPVFCNRNHTAIRVQSHCDKICNQLHSGLQRSFFLQSQHISRCKHTAKDVAITSILTRLQPIKQRPP
jgi:hypothetical protein